MSCADYIIFGDPHISENHQFSKPEQNGYSTRLKESIESAEYLAALVDSWKPKAIVCLGDVFHTQSTIKVWCLDAVTKFIKTIAESCVRNGVPFYIVVGNHDQLSNNNNSTHALKAFDGYMGIVYVIDELFEIDNLVFIPYVSDGYMIKSQIDAIQDKQSKIVFSHLDLLGALFNSSMKADKGLNPEWFKDFKIMFNGHFHLPQEEGNIVHPGSLQEWSFREPKNDKLRGIILYDEEQNKYNRVCVPRAPRWITLDDNTIDNIKELYDNNYVRLVLSSEGVLSMYGIDKSYLDRFKGYEISYEIDAINPATRGYDEFVDNISNTDDLKSLKDYIQQCETNLDKDTLFDTGKELMETI